MERKQVCKYCGKKYAMEWAKRNHEKLCLDKENETNNGRSKTTARGI